MPKLALSLLGAPLIEYNGTAVELDRHKSLALLAYLSITGERLRRDTLAALLWPDLDQRRARSGLRAGLWALSKALPGAWWEVEREALRLRLDPDLWLDVAQFQQQLAACRNHGHPADHVCSACLAPLAAAVELHRGEFLAGFTLRDCPAFDTWQFAVAEQLSRDLASALERLAQWHAGQSQFEPAVAHARRWLALDPLNEPAHRQLMRLYAWSEQRSAALRQYADCERLLEAELGVAPQAATRDLYQTIKDNRLPGPDAGPRAHASVLPGATTVPAPTAPPLGRRKRRLRRPPACRTSCAGLWLAASTNGRRPPASGTRPERARARCCWSAVSPASARAAWCAS